MADADLHFYFDPVCPFAWLTSKWVRQVAAQRDYAVDWRFISLRLVNADVDYDSQFPPEYEAGHTAGLRLLRVLHRARAEHGREVVGPLLEQVGLPRQLTDALDDSSADLEIGRETDEALALTGKDVGTPIIHFQPPDGVAFFGPVISRLPSEEDAVRLWDHVLGLAAFPGFAELKRSIRELPQLRGLGVEDDDIGVEQDWHGGSRRTKK
jgi:hypothetical protein